MFNLGPMELLVIVVVALVVLGPQRLPDAMRQVGKGVAEARRWSTQVSTEVRSVFDDGETRPSSPPRASGGPTATAAAIAPPPTAPPPVGAARSADQVAAPAPAAPAVTNGRA